MTSSLASVHHRSVDTDLSPVEMLRALRDKPGLFALFGDWHRQDPIIGFAPAYTLEPREDPFAAVGKPIDELRLGDAFGGGLVGYWGYQLGATIEDLPRPPFRPHPQPSFSLAYYDRVLRLDTRAGRWRLEALESVSPDLLDERLAQVLDAVRTPPAAPHHACGVFGSTPSGDRHRTAVESALAHIRAGDIFQANICRRLEASFAGDPVDLFCAGYERLRPRFGSFLRTPGGAIASFSPELFLRRTGRDVLTSPIKGTASLETDPADLAASSKDRAENIMIVDLMRNDLGRVCAPGSIHVEQIARSEEHTGVHHLLSDVRGVLGDGRGDGELLRATFPPGSVTGAPKVRAMEIIDELEPTGREVYTGAIGFASPVAGLTLSVAIRTLEFNAGRVRLGVGGGIVADSDPGAECHETLVKAKPLLDAIGARFDDTLQAEWDSHTAKPADRPPRRQAPVTLDLPRPDEALGVFETMLVVDGNIEDLDAHLVRLAASLADRYDVASPSDLRTEVCASAQALRGFHRLRVSVRPDAGASATITTSRLEGRPNGSWRLVPATVPSGMGGHKWQDRQILELVEPAPQTWSGSCDALLVDADGAVLETGRGNVFVVTDRSVHTPATDGRILPGVTRARAIAQLRAVGVPVHEHALTLDDLGRAVEVFVTNSLGGVRPVTQCDGGGSWPIGRTTAWLRGRLVRAYDERSTRSARRRRREAAHVVLIDNYDSFVYNLDQYLQELGSSTTVVRNDAIEVDELLRMLDTGRLSGIVLSPGPGGPDETGICNEVVERLGPRVPILGVCLGHQCIGQVYGARVVRSPKVVHGKASLVHHDGLGVFAGLQGPLVSGRYHSLVIDPDTVPAHVTVTAATADGTIMGVRHAHHPVEGVQLHPESILTRFGHDLLANFLGRCEDH